MGYLWEGEWREDSEFPTDEHGAFVRPASSLRERVTSDGSSPYAVEAGRYHLFASYACPWAHRTLIARALMGLEHAISVSFTDPVMGAKGWVLRDGEGAAESPLPEAEFLWQVYTATKPTYSGRVTVPVLWDRRERRIVNHESRDILRMLTTEFRALARRPEVDLSPPELRAEIDATIDAIYDPINNGVYRAGFAKKQEAYETAVHALFEALDHWEGVLSRQRFLLGSRLTEADICLFTTLFRFDLVYVTHFKCNVRRLVDYPNLWGFVRDLYAMPGVAATCRVDHIKTHYFRSHPAINPCGIVPVGPQIDFSLPHGRAER